MTDLAREPGVLALGEVMDFQGLVDDDPHLVGMVRAAADAGLSLEGHVPTLTGPELSRYVAHGIRSDHTLSTPHKVHEQLRKGLWVMLQEKSLTRDVVAAVMALPDRSRVLLITDDVMPNRLTSGHLSRIVEVAIAMGWEPLDAVAAATLRPASYLGLHDLGVLAPGARADWLVTDGVAAYPPRQVVVDLGAPQPVDPRHRRRRPGSGCAPCRRSVCGYRPPAAPPPCARGWWSSTTSTASRGSRSATWPWSTARPEGTTTSPWRW